jgi:AraC-like DNA-binding protein
MKRASNFKVSPTWKLLLSDMQIDTALVLAYAKLPADLFNRESTTLTALEYFQFWYGLEMAAGCREVPLLLAEYLSAEAFDAPIFASICSPDLNTALARIKQYKPLIGPMDMTIIASDTYTSLSLSCYGYSGNLPVSLAMSEMVFFTQLARLATRVNIVPLKVVVPDLPKETKAYDAYFGCKPVQGEKMEIIFSHKDATRPFLTSNVAMWDFFEGGLNQNLSNLTLTNTTVERVKSVLVELLPAGASSIETVAEKLALSKRTLQRKLTDESEHYHSVLQAVRIDLAEHYLNRSQLSLDEISFLLGYQEANSFSRAFTVWKGIPPGSYREALH